MAREEEIIETAKFTCSPSSGIPQSLPMRVGFIEGAKWADKTMIDKVCKWIQCNISEFVDGYSFNIHKQELIEKFRKAMEE